jgi:mRNA degradation ribonuclease J1/J2
MAETGIIVAAVVWKPSSGEIVSGPKFEGRGLSAEETAFFPRAAEPVLAELRLISAELLADETFLKAELAAAVRKVFKNLTGKRPAVIPVAIRA